MQFVKVGNNHYSYAVGSQPEYRIVRQTGDALRWVVQSATPNEMGGSEVGFIGAYRGLAEAKRAANYAERTRLGDDPNRDRKAYLEAEIDEAVRHVVADARAVAEAQARLDSTADRLGRLKRELDGILALEASDEVSA